MHENRLGKTNGFTCQPLDVSSESEIFAFDTLGVSLSDSVLVRIKIFGVATPLIGVESIYADLLE